MLKLVVRSLALVLAIAGCGTESVTGVSGIAYSASARVATESYVIGGDVLASPIYHLTTTATLRNISAAPVKLQFGGCVVHTLLHTIGDFGSVTAYDSGEGRFCASILVLRTLAPGDSAVFTDLIFPSFDPVPLGTFAVSAVVNVGGSATTIPAGIVTIEKR